MQPRDAVLAVQSAVILMAGGTFTDGDRVLYLNRNDAKRNLYVNHVKNDWNDNCRFAVVR